MYFFYFDETGSRDTRCVCEKTNKPLDHLYVLTAVGLLDWNWQHFDRAIANLKLELSDNIWKRRLVHTRLTLADCEVKSIWLRNPKARESNSKFLCHLSPAELTRISEAFFTQLATQHMRLFSVVIDKRELRDHMTAEMMHKKAYELLLERIENHMWTEHNNHNGLMVMDDTERALNRAVAMKHAFFQREGNGVMKFKHIVEYPFFTDSRLSNGVQLADLCSYNIYRAFRMEDFAYPYFSRMVPHFHTRKSASKLDGLKVWPATSPLVQFATAGYGQFLLPPPIVP